MYLEILRHLIHYSLHFGFPFAIAYFFYPRQRRKTAGLLMVSTIIIDLDHLLATPVFDPNRCSIGFHPLHTGWAFTAYVAMLFLPRWQFRAFGLGCILHLATDWLDCTLKPFW